MMKRYSTYLIPLAAFLIGGAAVFVWNGHVVPVQDAAKGNCDKDYAFIDPDVDCDSTDQASDQIAAVKDQVGRMIGDEQSAHHIIRASVFFRDLNTRRWFGVNDDVAYYTGSLVKLPLAMGYYKLSELQPGVLDGQLTIPKEDIVVGNTDQHYPPADPLVADTPYSVADMIRHMLVYSDNTPFGTLTDHGKDFVGKAFKDLGISEVKDGDMVTGWTSSVRTYSTALRSLYSASYLNAHDSNGILDLLSQSTFGNGIVAGIPGGVKVAHKFGEGTGVTSDDQVVSRTLNDCGIVYRPGHPFIICVMTEGEDFSQMEKVIQEIAAASYAALP